MYSDREDTVTVSAEGIFLVASTTHPIVKEKEYRPQLEDENCDKVFPLDKVYFL